MHRRRAFRHLERPAILLVRPLLELGFPGRALGCDFPAPLLAVAVASERAPGKAGDQRSRRGLRIATDADRDRLDQAQHPRIGVDLDDLRRARPVIESMLWQRAARSEP